MPNWKVLVDEFHAAGTTHDSIRRKYLARLNKLTGRNVIGYYSGWLQKPDLVRSGFSGFYVNDSDKNGFMVAIHQMDKKRGLDLVLHTPGGETAATESLVDYLRSIFGTDIRAIVPQLAMSAGTMISLAAREIVMGKHSSLGPIDPQIGGVPAHGVIEEFTRAKKEVVASPDTFRIWQPIIAKYNPTLIGECEKAILWSNEICKDWLMSGMFAAEADKDSRADRVIQELGDHSLTKSHARHISLSRAQALGLHVIALESDARLQEAVLSVHHAFVQTLAATATVKIVENHKGIAYASSAARATA